MLLILSSLLVAMNSFAFDMDVIRKSNGFTSAKKIEIYPNKESNDKAIERIYLNMLVNFPPRLDDETQYFHGECLTSYSAAAIPQTYTATVAIAAGEFGTGKIAYATNQGTVKSYSLKADLEELQKAFPLKEKPMYSNMTKFGGAFLEFEMEAATERTQEVLAQLSVDGLDRNVMYFVAPFVGHYCTLNRIL